MFSLLDRVIAREVTLLTVIYGLGFLALIAVAVTVPLIRGGAPLWDVLTLIPNQLVFPATLVIPMALVTALLSTIARLREDGELVAFMAAGISSTRLLRAVLPLVLVAGIIVGYLAHIVMPQSYRAFYVGQAGLLRQAIATQVARKEPFHQVRDPDSGEQLTLAAGNASGNELQHVFAWRQDEQGQRMVAYAPMARWRSLEDEQAASGLELDLSMGRILRFPGHNQPPALGYPHAIGSIPRWSMVVTREATTADHRSEGMSTGQLSHEIRAVREEVESLDPVAQRAHRIWRQRTLRDRQLAFHTRFLLPLGIAAWSLFAIGLALTTPSRNRVSTIGIGLASIILTVIPGFALVKGMRGHLEVNPAYLLYGPAFVLALIGIWLIYRAR